MHADARRHTKSSRAGLLCGRLGTPLKLVGFVKKEERRRSSDAGPFLVYSDGSSESATMPMCDACETPEVFTWSDHRAAAPMNCVGAMLANAWSACAAGIALLFRLCGVSD